MAVRQIIRLRYNNLTALQEELVKLFPNGDFDVEIVMGQITLTLPRELLPEEIQRINSKQRHYRRRSDRQRSDSQRSDRQRSDSR
ncbi:df9ba8f4-a43f-415a-aad8-3fb9e5419a73 [Thermothielavioides terrestris]|uniref:Df9ba8f4-a43f-415a-aad8-3fb9e5419a73 n=1 Tax=Thermothielavioides terrestris TaxID=2587410 RepID=A0A446BJK8_9PEZI|nr:df9ba8f4-a43f-415a-aad8-3fb9e5419a73 [Thermothielavioides terrestris]